MPELIIGSLLGGVLAVVAMLLGRRKRRVPAVNPEAVAEVVGEQVEAQLEEIEEDHAKVVRKLDSKHAAIQSANISEIVDILNSEYSAEEVLDD
jgi:predicted CoA-binding protein